MSTDPYNSIRVEKSFFLSNRLSESCAIVSTSQAKKFIVMLSVRGVVGLFFFLMKKRLVL